MPKPAPEWIKDRFSYNPETGEFKRIFGSGAGSVVGTRSAKGYIFILMDGAKYTAQQVAWVLSHGVWPNGRINFINGNRVDLRLKNLREVFKSSPDDELTHERVLEVLDYSGSTGIFKWKVFKGSPMFGRDAAGSTSIGWRYTSITIDQKPVLAHRLAWFYVHGEWPKNEIDHINGDGADNRIANLRDVTHAVNMQNIRKKTSKNKSGNLMGVSVGKIGNITASITLSGVTSYLGTFKTQELAHEAYIAAKREMHEGCTI